MAKTTNQPPPAPDPAESLRKAALAGIATKVRGGKSLSRDEWTRLEMYARREAAAGGRPPWLYPSRAHLAEALGVSERTVAYWCREGCPAGQAGQHDELATRLWAMANGRDCPRATTDDRLATYLATVAAELDRARGTVADDIHAPPNHGQAKGWKDECARESALETWERRVKLRLEIDTLRGRLLTVDTVRAREAAFDAVVADLLGSVGGLVAELPGVTDAQRQAWIAAVQEWRTTADATLATRGAEARATDARPRTGDARK